MVPKVLFENMEGELTDNELHYTLFEHMNGSSSPGVDGFTANYLRVFWPDMKDLTRDALNASIGNNLTQILNSAIFKLLRKGDKNPLLAESYRPISLLSIFYKLASCCITMRIKPVVELLIGKQQKAYITSNNIGSCILNLVNMMNYVNKRRQAALILLIDFKKAFDSIDHTFIDKSLKLFGFGENVRKWIRTFFNKRSAYIFSGGHKSKQITLFQGVPQGDILSPYIFLLAVEVLLIKINHTMNIEGIRYAKSEARSETFADDTTIFIKRTDSNLKNCLRYLKLFAKTSGLQCNIGKTKVIPIGDLTEKSRTRGYMAPVYFLNCY